MLSINPTYSDALVGVAMVMAESERVEEGWEYMRRATEAAPDKPDMHNNLGAYLLKMSKQTRMQLFDCIGTRGEPIMLALK